MKIKRDWIISMIGKYILKLSFICVFCLVGLIGSAKVVDLNLASNIARNFYYQNVCLVNGITVQGINPELIYECKNQDATSEVPAGLPLYYIFNINNNSGFVIVAGNDIVLPILGYSNEGGFDPANQPPAFKSWIEGYKAQILDAIKNELSQTSKIAVEWNNLISNKLPSITRGAKSVNQLLTTKWNQALNYNDFCPYDYTYKDRTVTGCVATAMAQIMKYYNYPAQGMGSYSYSLGSYGTLSADFGNTTYNWGLMPNNVIYTNSAVALLMYHCGVSVGMNYNVGSQGGSGAPSHALVNSYKNYFGYDNGVSYINRWGYDDPEWIEIMKTELDSSRPVQYAGYGNFGGHSFVMDGYDTRDYFHFNWGWGGTDDGYFMIDALNPGGTTTFNDNQEAVIGIRPSHGNGPIYNLSLYSAITTNPDPIEYNKGFSVSVKLANNGTGAENNFAGDYCAMVYNSNNQFVTEIETKYGLTLNYNSHTANSIVFSTAANVALVPGNYTIGIYYRTAGSVKWHIIANGNYQNPIPVKVSANETNTLKLYAAITSSPAIISRNQTFTVNLNIINSGSATFTGDIYLEIYKSDGTWIRRLSVAKGLSLLSNAHFTNGLSFTITGGINDSPATYYLFVMDKPTSGSMEIIGSGSYINPAAIQLVEPGLNPDPYEFNDNIDH
jgi:hypothetical protein